MTNIMRHARASRAAVSFKAYKKSFVVTIEDNGRGIKEEKSKDIKSFGLIGMRERALSIGGDLKISGNKEGGARVELTVPATEGTK